jgi:hypothetical protein
MDSGFHKMGHGRGIGICDPIALQQRSTALVLTSVRPMLGAETQGSKALNDTPNA